MRSLQEIMMDRARTMSMIAALRAELVVLKREWRDVSRATAAAAVEPAGRSLDTGGEKS